MIGLSRPPVFTAPDPAAWLDTHLSARFDPYASGAPGPVLGVDDALHGLPAMFDRLLAHGTPPQPAALYLSGWFGGGVASAVGFGLALGGAGYLVRPDEVRWTMHPEGWPERTSFGMADAVVLADHPWAAAGVAEVASSADELLARTVEALVAVATPIVDACHRLTKVGRAGLWNEVGDGLGTALAWERELPVDPAMTEVLAAALRVPSAPWKAKADLRFAATSSGPVHVAQKGGCCLAYTAAEGHKCTACSLHTPAECDAACVAWFEGRTS